MKTRPMWIVAAAVLLGNALHAQSIAGIWQGTVTFDGYSFRQVLKFVKADSGWKTVYYSLDQASDSVIATSMVLEGQNLKLAFPPHIRISRRFVL